METPQNPELPATAYALLGLLVFYGRDSSGITGYELKQRADNTLRYYWVSPAMSQIYTELRRLKDSGLVEPVGHHHSRSTRYRITDEGDRALREWLFERDAGFPVLKHPVALRLLMGRLSTPEQLQAMLDRHIDDLAARRADLQAVRDMLGENRDTRYAAMVADWGLAYYDSEAETVAELIERIEREG